MKLNKSKFKSKFYHKIVIFSLLISILPVIFIGTFSYIWSSNIAKNKVNMGNSQVLKQTQMRVEQGLKVIDNSVLQFIISQNVSNAEKKELTLNDFQIISEVENSLKRIDTGEIKIYEAEMVSIKNGWVISSWDFESFDNNDRKSLSNKYSYMINNHLWSTDQNLNSNSVSTYGINLVRKIQTYDSTNTSDFVAVKVLSKDIEKLFSDVSQLGDLIILDSKNNVVIDTKQELLGRNLNDYDYIRNIEKSKSNNSQFYKVMGNQKYAVTYVKSDYNNWTYISILPLSTITKESQSIGWVTIYTCILILILICIIIAFYTDKIYSPVRALYENIICDNDFGQNYKDEFKTINEKVKGLMNQQFNMAKQIDSQVEPIKELCTIKLIHGEINELEIKGIKEIFSYTKNWTWICMFLLEIDSLENTPFKENDREIALFGIKNILDELIPADQRLNTVAIGNCQVTVIGSNHETYEAFLNYSVSQAEMIQNAILGNLKIKVSIGISSPYKYIGDTKKALYECEEAIRYSLRSGIDTIVHFNNIKIEYNKNAAFPKSVMDELIYSIKQGNEEKSKNLLHNFLNITFNNDLCFSEYQITMCRLLSGMTAILQDMDKTIEIVYSNNQKSMINYLFEIKSPAAIENWINTKILMPVLNVVRESLKSQHKKLSEMIIEIIEKEYDQDISLCKCAERLNYNSNYISKVFRDEMGINFSDYLSSYRLKVAKKWLTQTNMKISEIADKLQYNNPENFIRCFKKHENMTPGQYRERNT